MKEYFISKTVPIKDGIITPDNIATAIKEITESGFKLVDTKEIPKMENFTSEKATLIFRCVLNPKSNKPYKSIAIPPDKNGRY